VIVGIRSYNHGSDNEGGAVLYYGSATGLDSDAGGSGCAADGDWCAESDQQGANFGWSVGTAGDVNNDGFDDVIVGAINFDWPTTRTGAVFVYHGSATGLDNDAGGSGCAAAADWCDVGTQTDSYFGWSVGTAGDVDGDGHDDVIVGVRLYDDTEANEGKALVYDGSATGLSTTADWSAEANQTATDFGFSVGTAGDVNGDGYDDVVVGAAYFDTGPNPTNDGGGAFLYHGSPDGLKDCSPSLSCDLSDADWSTSVDQLDALLGWSVGTAGDVNGDGFADVVVGAPRYDAGHTDEGAAFLYYGGASASDCDDTDPGRSPGVQEVCDGKDNDCDGAVDEDPGLCDFGHADSVHEITGDGGWQSVAWGDWDGDGDLDVAVGTDSAQPNRVYENDGGALALAWSSTETDDTRSVVWGDWDNDGDLDLAVGNYSGQPNRVYENVGGALGLAWSSSESDYTLEVAWGDWDGDGDLDLAAANAGANRVYANAVNQGGTLAVGRLGQRRRPRPRRGQRRHQ
jgi:hypothetical protein